MRVCDFSTGKILGVTRRVDGRKYEDQPEVAVRAGDWLTEAQCARLGISSDHVIYFEDNKVKHKPRIPPICS